MGRINQLVSDHLTVTGSFLSPLFDEPYSLVPFYNNISILKKNCQLFFYFILFFLKINCFI
jgi:hypothetical protein